MAELGKTHKYEGLPLGEERGRYGYEHGCADGNFVVLSEGSAETGIFPPSVQFPSLLSLSV